MKKPAIPSVMGVSDPVARNLLAAIKENIEVTNGIRGGELKTLPTNATLSDCISKINEIIERINAQ
jgi:hypothetical protein